MAWESATRIWGCFFITATTAMAQLSTVVFSENFNSLNLEGSVNERIGAAFVTRVSDDQASMPIPNVYSPEGPAGWVVNSSTFGQFDGVPKAGYTPSATTGNSGVPGRGVFDYGVDEWEGWSFVNKQFWVDVAGGQNRDLFTNAIGTVAVVDPDEYYDLGDPDDPFHGGYYNSSLSTPAVNVAAGELYTISFDSSWRDEAFDNDHPIGLTNANNQAVELLARFNNGSTVVVEGWNSDSSSGTFKNDVPNERVTGAIFVPNNASAVTFEFNMANAGNDWWWAIDNIDMRRVSSGTTVFAEDFEGVALGSSVNERQTLSRVTVPESTPDTVSRPNSFTHQTPTGWSVDNSGLPGGGRSRDDVGVFEYEGWTFLTQEFWTFSDDQGRTEFTKCQNICAVADSDEFDDLANASNFGPLDTLLKTPEIDISGVGPGQLGMTFDSAWRAEGSQTAIIEAEYFDGNGNSLGIFNVLRWESAASSPSFKPDNTNESVFLPISNPSGAESVQFEFAYLNGSNNWFWAIDNVQVGSVTGGATCDFDGNGACDVTDIDRMYTEFGGSNPAFDLDADGDVDNDDLTTWLNLASDASPSGQTFIRGDADLDGTVGGSDFTTLAANFGGGGTWSNGNFVVDAVFGGGNIGGPDFTALASNFGTTSMASVPEPGMSWLVGVSLLAFCGLQCGRRGSHATLAAHVRTLCSSNHHRL